MKKILIILSYAILTAFCTPKMAHFTGKIQDYNGSKVSYVDEKNITGSLNDIIVNKDGSFSFDIDAEGLSIYYLIFDNPKSGFKFYVKEGMKADFQIHHEKVVDYGVEHYSAIANYKGKNKDCFEYLNNNSYFDAQNKTLAKIQNHPMTFVDFRDDLRHNVDSLETIIDKLSDKLLAKKLKSDYEDKFNHSLIWYCEFTPELDPDFKEWAEGLDRNNDLDMASLFAMAYKTYYLPKEGDNNVYFFKGLNSVFTNKEIMYAVADQMIGTVLADAPNNIDEIYEAYLAINTQRAVPEEITKLYEHYRTMTAGQKANDFDMYDIDGNKVMLSDLKGKYVYIDCWATWCGPCKMEIPYMEKLYEHYKDNADIVLISVSIDEKVNDWKNMVEKDKPQWKQFIVKNALESDLCKNYGITGIPRFIMVDKYGNLINLNAPRPSTENIIEWIDSQMK